jgi:hypothetical protein
LLPADLLCPYNIMAHLLSDSICRQLVFRVRDDLFNAFFAGSEQPGPSSSYCSTH